MLSETRCGRPYRVTGPTHGPVTTEGKGYRRHGAGGSCVGLVSRRRNALRVENTSRLGGPLGFSEVWCLSTSVWGSLVLVCVTPEVLGEDSEVVTWEEDNCLR